MPRGTGRYDEAARQGRLWTPAVYRGGKLLAWFSASDLASLVLASGNVATWRDKSGRGNHVSQATSGNRPAFQAKGFNGRPALSFSAASLTGSISVPAGTLLQAFVVFRPAGGIAYSRVISTNNGSGTDHDAGKYVPMLRAATSANQWSAYSGGLLSSSGPVADGSDGVMSSILSATVQTSSANGVPATPVAFTYPGTYAPTQLFIGQSDAGPAGSDPFGGLLVEIVLLTGSISLAERARLEGYLAWNNGMQGKMAAGPFKNRPPMIGD